MSAQTRISLTAKQHDLLVQSLDLFDRHILKRGMQLFVSQAVRKVDWVEPNVVLNAEVQGGELYTVALEFSRDFIATSCTCPYEVNCKHAAALILHLQTQSVVSAITQDKTPKPPKPVKTAVVQPDADTFPGRAAARLGIPLPASQLKFLQQVETWWVGRQRTVPQMDLFKLCGRNSYWGYGQVELWPAEFPPADEIEFFAYLASAFSICNLALPDTLAKLADPKVQKRLIQQWTHLKEIEEWRQRLGSWQEPKLQQAAEAPELRLVLHATGALVQVRHPGDAEFGKATQKLLKQLWGGSIYYGSGPQNLLSAGSNLVLKAALVDHGELRPADIPPLSDSLAKSLAQLISSPQLFQTHVVTTTGDPLPIIDEPLRWDLQPPAAPGGDYELRLLDEEGRSPLPPLAIVPGFPLRYVTREAAHAIHYWPFGSSSLHWPVCIPSAALETKEGVSALAKLGVPVPQRLEGRVKIIRAEIDVRCKLTRLPQSNSDYLKVRAQAKFGGMQAPRQWSGTNWGTSYHFKQTKQPATDELVQIDSSNLPAAGAWLAQWPLRPVYGTNEVWLE